MYLLFLNSIHLNGSILEIHCHSNWRIFLVKVGLQLAALLHVGLCRTRSTFSSCLARSVEETCRWTLLLGYMVILIWQWDLGPRASLWRLSLSKRRHGRHIPSWSQCWHLVCGYDRHMRSFSSYPKSRELTDDIYIYITKIFLIYNGNISLIHSSWIISRNVAGGKLSLALLYIIWAGKGQCLVDESNGEIFMCGGYSFKKYIDREQTLTPKV